MTTVLTEAGVAEELSRLLSRLDLDPTPASPSLLETRTRNSKLPQPPTGNWQPKTSREFSAKKARNYREIRALPKKITNNINKIIPVKKLARKTPVSGGTRRAAPAKATRLPPIIWKATPRLPPSASNPELLRKPKTENWKLRNSKLASRPPLTRFSHAFPFLRPTLSPATDREKSAKLPRKIAPFQR